MGGNGRAGYHYFRLIVISLQCAHAAQEKEKMTLLDELQRILKESKDVLGDSQETARSLDQIATP
jgi:hypothetical protein